MAPRTTCLLLCPCQTQPLDCLWTGTTSRHCTPYASWRKPSTAITLQYNQPQGNGSLLSVRWALHHLTFEINSVTSEEDLVTDVTEESDHKTLKTNKRTNLKNRHHIHNSHQLCPGNLAGAGAGNTRGPSVLCTLWTGAFTHPLTCWRKSIHPGPKVNLVFCAIAQISPNYSSMEPKVCSLKF